MLRTLLSFFTLWVALFTITGNAIAAETETVVLDNSDVPYFSAAEKAILLEDKGHLLNFKDVLNPSPEIAKRFVRLDKPIPNLNFTSSSWWVKFDVKNESGSRKDIILEVARPITNKAILYIVYPNNLVIQLNNGDDYVFGERPVPHRKLMFPVTFQSGESLSFFLELSSDGEVITLPVRLWNPSKLQEKDYHEQMMFGIYFGILLFVVIIYFFFYVALKDRSFLYYVLYVLSLFLLQFSLDGLSFQYLWPGSTWLGNHAVLIGACLTVVFVVKYAQKFLHSKERIPVFHKLLMAIFYLALFCLFLSLTPGKLYSIAFPATNAISLLSCIFVVCAIVASHAKGYKVNLFFSFAFLSVIAGAIIFILDNFNAVPHTFFTEHSLKFGSAVEVILLSLSMANKYREIQQEKELAQAETLKQMAEMNKLKDEINIELERQVKERTHEINLQKEELAAKNKDITDSINYSKRIQQAILPREEEVTKLLRDSFVLFKPKDIISGDFYWVNHKGNLVFYTVADCTGHGVPGALMSMVGTSLFNQVVLERGITSPELILNEVREGIINAFKQKGEKVEQKDGMDAALCAWDTQSNKLLVSCANNPVWIVSNMKLTEIRPDKQAIGYAHELKPFTKHELQLMEGDTIYLFSDGYEDQFGGPKEKKFMISNLRKLLLSVQDKTMQEQKSILNNTIEEWRGQVEQTDDICVIGMRI